MDCVDKVKEMIQAEYFKKVNREETLPLLNNYRLSLLAEGLGTEVKNIWPCFIGESKVNIMLPKRQLLLKKESTPIFKIINEVIDNVVKMCNLKK